MPYINVDEVYILNNTGLQVDQVVDSPYVDAGFTDTQKERFRKNIAAGGSNDNLLDNAYFVGGGSQLGDGVFPINQRGQSSYTGNSIGMDRWRNNGNGTTVLNADNVTFSNTNGWKDGLNQRYAGNRFPLGSQVTFTVQMSDLSYHSCTITVPTTADTQTLDVQAGTSGIYFAVRTNNGYYSQAFIMCDPSTSASIRWAKAELGTVSTLANDVPPDFDAEFEKCRYYLRYIPLTRYAIAINGANAYMTMIGMPMHGVPTPSLPTAGGVRDAGGQSSITSATVTGYDKKIATVQFALSASRAYVVGYIYDTVLCLSAEL